MKLALISVSLILIIGTIFHYFALTDLDTYRISTRRSYYPKVASRVFQNKLTESFDLTKTRLFSVLSLDHLFRAFGYE